MKWLRGKMQKGGGCDTSILSSGWVSFFRGNESTGRFSSFLLPDQISQLSGANLLNVVNSCTWNQPIIQPDDLFYGHELKFV